MAHRPAIARKLRALGGAVLIVLASVAAGAVEPDEMLADPALEARAREIGKELRCLVCQNQSIDDSDAELARDLRVLVRERLSEGDSNGEVIDYVVSRYGDFVLLTPPFKESTYALWLGPAGLAVVALVAAVFFYRRRRTATNGGVPAPLSAEEERRIEKALRERDR